MSHPKPTPTPGPSPDPQPDRSTPRGGSSRLIRRIGAATATATAALLLLAHASTASAAPATTPKVGDPFPDLTTFGLEGTLPDLKGHVVLVDFWASWCGPCKKSFPVMAELHRQFTTRGFTVLAVGVDEKVADLDAFLAKTKPPFPTVRDPKGRLAEAVGVATMPTSFLVGADGRILAIHHGFDGEATRKKYTAEIEAATARK